jgi:CBS domain containing-hemolysin-like protein
MVTMTIFLVILAVLIFVGLVLTTAMQPVRSPYSVTELKRRAKYSEAFLLELDRHEQYAAMTTLLRSTRAAFLVILVALLIGACGWWLGILVALIAALSYPSVARLKSIQRFAESTYHKIESSLLNVTAQFERALHGFREPATIVHEKPKEVYSVEELTEVVEQSKEAIGEHERRLLVAALAFPTKKVASVMVSREQIDYIKGSEFLGPLVLDELHALGHSRLPVIGKDLDHVVGILHLRDLLSLDVRQSTTAEKAMEKKIHSIAEDATLEQALITFMKHRVTVLIVIDPHKTTVGMLTLEDIISELIGTY